MEISCFFVVFCKNNQAGVLQRMERKAAIVTSKIAAASEQHSRMDLLSPSLPPSLPQIPFRWLQPSSAKVWVSFFSKAWSVWEMNPICLTAHTW